MMSLCVAYLFEELCTCIYVRQAARSFAYSAGEVIGQVLSIGPLCNYRATEVYITFLKKRSGC